MSYPVGGDERNLLIEPVAGKYRLTQSGYDVRTADPVANPEQFEFWEDSLSFDLVLATGSFVPDLIDNTDVPVMGIEHDSMYLFYYKVLNTYFYQPAMKGHFFASPTYSTGLRYKVEPWANHFSLPQLGPKMVRESIPPIYNNPGQNVDWTYSNGFNSYTEDVTVTQNGEEFVFQVSYNLSPVNWMKISLAPQKPAGIGTGINRFKVRSTADGGGFMISSKGHHVGSVNLDDFIVHPDKKTVQVIATVEITIPAGTSQLLPLPADSGKPMPLIFQRGGSSYTHPFVKQGFAISVCSFEYEAGGVRIRNDAGTSVVDFSILFLNVEMA